MKWTLLIAVGATVLFLVAQLVSLWAVRRVEQVPYRVVERLRDLEVRAYPPHWAVGHHTLNARYAEAAPMGFRRLARYIFGGNDLEERIAMTAPVTLEQGDRGYTVYFGMPGGRTDHDLPVPDDPTVLVLERPSTRMACVRFGGRATDARIAREVERLHRALAGSPWRAIGPPVVMGYDPPWQLLGRRNEVGVAVERTDGQG
ncbi:MAG: heme-binding protein [Flavobacteriales bacterium]|nr:heme-binding protein [Flavobacteriales bacterium]